MVISKATSQQNLDLSKLLWSKGLTPEQALEYLKENKYTIKGIQYSASIVAQGINMILTISEGIKAGKLKSSKAKGLHL